MRRVSIKEGRYSDRWDDFSSFVTGLSFGRDNQDIFKIGGIEGSECKLTQ